MARLFSAPDLMREIATLRSMLDADEVILDAERVGRGFFKAGILVITDRRFMHLYFRRLMRRMKVLDLPYRRVNSVELMSAWRSWRELLIRFDRHTREEHLPVFADPARASELRNQARAAMSDYRLEVERDLSRLHGHGSERI
jgi:hypothetical protein